MRKSLVVAASLALSAPALAGAVSFVDPKGDDNGPGAYTYPTDPAYKKGSFDLTDVSIKDAGDSWEITLGVAAPIDDPWDSAKWPTPGNGFSLQMFQLYVDSASGGEINALPGMNATFADGWERVVIISPQANKEIGSRVEQKAKTLKDKIALPSKVTAKGKKVTALIKKSELPGVDFAKAGIQVLVGSNEGFDKEHNNGILARIVNEFEGQHRFGGGDDGDVNPNFVDCLAGKAKGSEDEVAAQHEMLKFDPKGKKRPVLKMVRAG